MGSNSKAKPRAFAFTPLKILGIEDTEDGGLRLTVEAVRPGPVNQFNVTEEFIDATLEKWVGQHVVATHDTNARLDLVHGEITSARKHAETKALIFEIDINKTSATMIENIRKKRAAVSIGANDPILSVDPETSPAPWDVIDATPNHLMITRKDEQAQPNAQILQIHATMGDALADLYNVGNLNANKVSRFGDFLLANILQMVHDDRSREMIEAQLIEVAKITPEKLASLLSGDALPNLEEIRAFAKILWADIETMLIVAEASGADFSTSESTDSDVEAPHLDDPEKDREAHAEDVASSLPKTAEEIAAAQLKLQSKEAQDTQAMTKELEARIVALEAENATLKVSLAEVEKDRDKIQATFDATVVAGLEVEVHEIEASMGKQENELTKLDGKSVDEARTALLNAHRAFKANPPQKKPKVPVTRPPLSASAAPARKQLRPLFARADPWGDVAEGETTQ